MTTTIERPILFNGAMVRAILEGRKTQTRRVVNPQPAGKYLKSALDGEWLSKPFGGLVLPMIEDLPMECHYGQPGDRLWVRETFRETRGFDSEPLSFYRYRATDPLADEHKWTPSIHMPRRASRILLEITAVRVERLQDISEADARAEGAPLELGELERLILGAKAKHRSGFVRLWQSINGEQSWHENPWVWVVEFKRVQQ